MDIEGFQLIKLVGKGGMGEVFVAYDLTCQREVALKRIRKKLLPFHSIRTRFLQEAHIAAKLSHPSIIPIFSICEKKKSTFYTMPYVQGATLKQVLQQAKTSDQKWNVMALIRIFMNVCQGVAYAHSKGVLHRDIKTENILVGSFGEVMILDWGLAVDITTPKEQREEELIDPESRLLPGHDLITHPGKIVGTLAYLAPERARHEPASEQTDLYALGVILYQILTLRLPFARTDIESFQKGWSYEELLDPVEAAPYREIPHLLNQIVTRALAPEKEKRYPKVVDMISDLEHFIEGRPRWSMAEELRIERKEDWTFQENILFAKQTAITRGADVMEWVNLMISHHSFSGNIKIEASVKLEISSKGIGFLLHVLPFEKQKSFTDGYCIWIGSEQHPGCSIFQCDVQVAQQPSLFLRSDVWQNVRIETSKNHLSLYVDEELQCQYTTHSWLEQGHVGLLFRDAKCELKQVTVFVSSPNITISCLAVPDRFLTDKEYQKARVEYTNIARSFPGRWEEREALFRSGIACLEEALSHSSRQKRKLLLTTALSEFHHLRNTSGAPLEYLGKSLVYKAMGETEEEVKCIEIAVRKYRKHPLFSRLVEHVIFRLHESALHDRSAAYQLALIALLHLPQIFTHPDHQQLLYNLRANLEPVPFLPTENITVQLAFFLDRPTTLLEILETNLELEEPFYALLQLGYREVVENHNRLSHFPNVQAALQEKWSDATSPALCAYLSQRSIDQNKCAPVLEYPMEDQRWKLWALLLSKQWELVAQLFARFPIEQLSSPSSPLFPLFGCYLWAVKGEEIAKAHFRSISDTPYPKTTTLLGHFILEKINLRRGWIETAFLWEKMELLRQLILFYRCTQNSRAANRYEKELKTLGCAKSILAPQ